ncbi:MAG TPA: hypothetical protein VJV22_00425 [Acidobacteriaceae bacterium]|nr:hypothetical protein [Acidobacteriaceae bacterium]
MSRDRRTILQLVALGRLSAGEAERLLLAWNEGRETAWVIAGCVALALIAALEAHGSVVAQIGQVLSLVSQIVGGVL